MPLRICAGNKFSRKPRRTTASEDMVIWNDKVPISANPIYDIIIDINKQC